MNRLAHGRSDSNEPLLSGVQSGGVRLLGFLRVGQDEGRAVRHVGKQAIFRAFVLALCFGEGHPPPPLSAFISRIPLMHQQ